MTDSRVLQLRWRVGRKLGRTVYAQAGHEPSDRDTFLGIFDSPEIARAVVDAHNVEAEDWPRLVPTVPADDGMIRSDIATHGVAYTIETGGKKWMVHPNNIEVYR